MHGCSPGYTLYEVVSSERSCQSYCTMAGGYGRLCTKPTPSPPHPVAPDSDAKEDDDDDGDDDDASNDDGDALPMRCLLDILPFVTRDKKGK